MKKIILLLSMIVLYGCASFEKQHYKATKFFNENESLAALYCSGKFPSQTEYIKGDPVVKIDTVPKLVYYQVDCDSLVNANKGTNKPNLFIGSKKVPCEQKTITITDTLKTPDLAREKVLNDKINDCNADNVLLKKEIKVYRNALIMAVILLAISLFLLIKRR